MDWVDEVLEKTTTLLGIGVGHREAIGEYRKPIDALTDEDLAKPGSDRFIDAVVAYGTIDDIAARLKQHRQAGADHVPVQVLTSPEKLVPVLTELAGPLGLA